MSLLEDARYEIKIAIDAGLTDDALADAIIDRFCRYFGGQTIYWPRAASARRARAICQARKGGLPINQIARQHGVSRRTVERMGSGFGVAP